MAARLQNANRFRPSCATAISTSSRTAEILHILNRNQSVNYAMRSAFGYLRPLRPRSPFCPDSDYKRALQWMPEFVVAREK